MAPSTSSATSFPPEIANDISIIFEKYPDVGKKISQNWGSSRLHDYLNSIIFDERGGRQGFPEQIGSALFRVHEGHSTLFPEIKRGDIWDVILDRIK